MQVGYEKNCDFLPIARFISETVQDKAVVSLLSNANTNSYVRNLSNGASPFPMTLNDLNPDVKVMLLSDAEYPRNGTESRHFTVE